MWFLKFIFGFTFIGSFHIILISLMRDLSNVNVTNKEIMAESKFRLIAIIVSAVSFGILISLF